jgi:endonuclease III
MTPATIAKRLQEAYPLPHRLFGVKPNEYGSEEWKRRRLFANILVSGSKDENAVAAATWMCSTYTLAQLADTKQAKAIFREIANTIEMAWNIRFAGRKTGYVLQTARMLVEQHGGKVPSDEKALRAFPGVAEHAAAVVRGLVFGEDTFGVDVHVRRIAKRMRLVSETAKDDKIVKVFLKTPKPAHTSRAFVDFGKDICGFKPRCEKCPFKAHGCDTTIV